MCKNKFFHFIDNTFCPSYENGPALGSKYDTISSSYKAHNFCLPFKVYTKALSSIAFPMVMWAEASKGSLHSPVSQTKPEYALLD
jgi:hypothetical protein